MARLYVLLLGHQNKHPAYFGCLQKNTGNFWNFISEGIQTDFHLNLLVLEGFMGIKT